MPLGALADAQAAAARIAAGLRSGGVLIVEDIDFTGSFCHPANAAYDRYAELYTQAARARGVDPNIGPRLPQLLVAAGCKGVRVNVVQPAGMTPEGHEGAIKLVSPLTLENIADSALRKASLPGTRSTPSSTSSTGSPPIGRPCSRSRASFRRGATGARRESGAESRARRRGAGAGAGRAGGRGLARRGGAEGGRRPANQLEGVRSATAVRQGAGSPRLGPPRRAEDQAGGDPPPRQPAAADRLAVLQPGRPRRVGGGRREAGGRRPGELGAGPLRRRQLGNPRFRPKHPGELLSERPRTGSLLGGPAGAHQRETRPYLAKTVAFARRCGAVSDRKLLAHITTAETARDLDHLRRLVGDRRLTFYGQSAGTMMGQTYANLFPRRVRAMALDSVVDPVAYTKRMAAWLASSIGSVDATFGAFLSLCQSAGPDRCPLAGSVPAEQRAQALFAQLRRAPLAAPTATPPGRLTYGELLTALKFSYSRRRPCGSSSGATWRRRSPGTAPRSRRAPRMSAADPFREVLEPMLSIACADSPAGEDANAWPRVVDRLTRVSRIGGPPLGWLIGAPCASWPVRATDRYTGPWNASTPNPILLVGTRFDPNTPLAGVRHAAQLLGNAILLTHDGYGHISTSDPSACVDEALSRYLVDLRTPPRGTVCRSDRLPFDPDFGQPPPRADGLTAKAMPAHTAHVASDTAAFRP
jgi:pimeloyl-ACP methyl ester carboxylesterase